MLQRIVKQTHSTLDHFYFPFCSKSHPYYKIVSIFMRMNLDYTTVNMHLGTCCCMCVYICMHTERHTDTIECKRINGGF